MAPAHSVPDDRSSEAPAASPGRAPAEAAGGSSGPEPVSQQELNAWRRGLTPQAEIWNGRLAMLGLSMGLLVLLLARLAGRHG